jgi:hypothetical protein
MTTTTSHFGFLTPSPLMGEGLDEGENPRFDMPWQVATLNGHNSLCPYRKDIHL